MFKCKKNLQAKEVLSRHKKYLLKEAHHTHQRAGLLMLCAQVVKSLTLLECEFAPKS